MKKIHYVLLICIIGLGVFLRTWKYQDLFYYAIDEEKAAYIISGIANRTHFPTVGHPSSIGFRLGPLQYYILAPFYWVIGNAPITWGYVALGVSIASMLLIFSLASKISRKTGFIALLLYNVSYLNTLYDRRGWQETFHSFMALGIVYSLLRIKKGNQLYIFPLTFALICATQFEVATILFIPLVLIVWKLLHLHVSTKKIIVCISLFFLSQSPLLLFDIRHQFINTKYLLNYFRPHATERIAANKELTGERSAYLAHNLIPYTFTRLVFPSNITNVAIQYANCPQYLTYKQTKFPYLMALAIILIISYVVYISLFRSKNISESEQLLTIISTYIVVISIFIALYTYIFHGEMAEYYLQSVFAYFFICVAYLLTHRIPPRLSWAVYVFLFITSYININSMLRSTNPYGYVDKLNAIKFSINEVHGKPFVVDSFQTCWYSGGYRYLYSYLKTEPTVSYMDQYLSEYYQTKTQTPPVYRIALLTPELMGENPIGYELFREIATTNALKKAKFGAIEVYIQKL